MCAVTLFDWAIKGEREYSCRPWLEGEGACYYTVDQTLPHGGTELVGDVVRAELLFFVSTSHVTRRPVAYVTIGRKMARERRMQCWDSFMAAERLVSYVHFGSLPGNCKLLNRFYIPM
jgi:hypothetical protein